MASAVDHHGRLLGSAETGASIVSAMVDVAVALGCAWVAAMCKNARVT